MEEGVRLIRIVHGRAVGEDARAGAIGLGHQQSDCGQQGGAKQSIMRSRPHADLSPPTIMVFSIATLSRKTFSLPATGM